MLKNNGTTHEKLKQFGLEQELAARNKQQEYEDMVAEMKKLDSLDLKVEGVIKNREVIQLHPIGFFQFAKEDRVKVFDILSITREARVTFNRMLDSDKVIPVANIYVNPIIEEGYGSEIIYDTGIKAWRNIFRVRKELYSNCFRRITVKIGQ